MSKLRKLAIVVATGAIVGLAAIWILTLPAVVPAAALPGHTPNLANGETMFNIGGCASCHAVPNENPDKVDRKRLGAEIAFRHLLRAQYFTRSQGRHRQLVRGEFRYRLMEGNVGARHQSLSGISLRLVSIYAAQ